jgi:hypothetical protein
MVLRAALALLLSGGSATAANRSTNIAMAVALLDVAREHCAITVDATVETKLMKDFHEYDIAGLASILSGPLNAFYEDFLARNEKRPRRILQAVSRCIRLAPDIPSSSRQRR